MKMAQSVAFGTLLRRYRVAAGFTQEELAERAGISRRSLSDMERGGGHTPRKDTIALLAGALDLPPREHVAFTEAAQRLGAAATVLPTPARTSVPPFVGRTRELDLLELHLAGEGPPLLLVAGEPGIGKTRLLHAALPRAVAHGFCVLEGGCQRRGEQEPYAPLLGALQHYISIRRPGQLQVDLQGCAWLVKLLPELTATPIPPLPNWTLTTDQERRLMKEAVVRFLTNVAGAAGTLLVLDDLQWAGPDALDLLATLARSASDMPLRIIGAYRDTEVQPPDALTVLMADLAHAGLATRRVLGPLAQHNAEQLLDEIWAPHDDTQRARVLQRAGGVPFFLLSCVQALQQDDHTDTRTAVVPWDVAQSVRQRIAALPEAAQRVLEVAAVIGRTVAYSLLKTVAARPEQEVLAGLEAACHAHLLEEEGTSAYRFTHDVIREVVEAELSAARRMVWHRAIAQGLVAHVEPAPVEDVAYHYARSDQPHQAIPYLVAAAQRARTATAIQTEEALLAEAITLAQRAEQQDVLGDLHARRGKALSDLTRWAQARAEMQAALDRVPPEGVAHRAEILVDMAVASHWLSDAASTRRLGTEALSLAEGLGREDLAIAALSTLVVADSAAGALSAGVARYRQAEARAAGHYLAQLALGMEFAGILHYWLGDFDEAIRLSSKAVDVGRAALDTSTMLRALGDLGCALVGSGRYAEAVRVFEEGQRESRVQGAINWLARTLCMHGGLLLDMYDFAGAEALAEEARELSRSAPSLAYWINPVVSGGIDLILNYIRRGDISRAEALVSDVAEGVARGQGAHGWLWHVRFNQAQAELALALHEWDHALQHADTVMARSRTLGRIKYEVAGLQVRGLALVGCGQTVAGLGCLRSAVARARQTTDPLMFLRPAAALLAIEGDDALLAEARATVERIAGALPSTELRRCFLEAEPMRAVMRLTGWDQGAGARS